MLVPLSGTNIPKKDKMDCCQFKLQFHLNGILDMKENLRENLKFVLVLIGILWLVWLIDVVNSSIHLLPNIKQYGIIPREPGGLIGIVLSPFLHANFNHLMANTVPLFVLGITTVIFYPKTFLPAMLIIVLLGGALVWVFAGLFTPTSHVQVHIGASGLIFGLIGFLLASGLFRFNFLSILISVIIAVVYGGTILYGVLPGQKGVSWQGHLFGALAGGVAAFALRKKSG